MKKIISIPIVAFLIAGFSLSSQAQSTADKVEHKVEKGAKKVGHKSAELASKGKAVVTDQVYKDKVGPDGETVYIDNHDRYYWIDKKGHRHYATEIELKDKPGDQ